MKTTIITIIGMILLLSVVSAEVISITPEILDNINIYSGESYTQEITIKTDGDYLVYLNHNFSGNEFNMNGFNIEYESPIFVEKEKTIPITISTSYNFKPDQFQIFLTASTEKAEEVYEETFTENETIIFGDLELEINGTGTITIKTFKQNPEGGFGIPSLNKFFEINSSIQANNSIIKVSYTDDEVNNLGIEESTLRLHFFNDTLNDWQEQEGGANTELNYVWAKTNHFSLWGIFGNLIPVINGDTNGGGSRGCITTWECAGWSDCVDEQQTRECSKIKNYCYAPNKPIEEQICDMGDDDPELIIDPEPIINPEDKKGYSYLTKLIITILVVIIILIIWQISLRLKKSKKDSVSETCDELKK